MLNVLCFKSKGEFLWFCDTLSGSSVNYSVYFNNASTGGGQKNKTAQLNKQMHSFRIHAPMKMEQTECSETSAIKNYTPENNPKDYTRNTLWLQYLQSIPLDIPFILDY
jgi:hypothetical protein